MTETVEPRCLDEWDRYRCLDEWDHYVRLDRRCEFLKRYWYPIAIGPFAVVMIVCFRFFPDSTSVVLDVFFGMTFGWGMLFTGYCLILFTRALAIRCPRCSWRFGLTDHCTSCGLSRHAPATTSERDGHR
jgi:hypothetical protein